MAFNENLSLFFDTTNGFAGEATIKTAGGVDVRTIKVILETPIEELKLFDAEVSADAPSFVCQTSDLAGVTTEHKILVAGTTYRIVKPPKPDGTGISTVSIRV